MEVDQVEVDFWEPVVNHPEYEIYAIYPYQIRKRKNKRIIKEILRSDGYVIVKLLGVSYYKHRLILQQFIRNINDFPKVDHINHIRNDNHLTNLRWCSHSENSSNIGTASNNLDMNILIICQKDHNHLFSIMDMILKGIQLIMIKIFISTILLPFENCKY
jgi:hypothetical protein